MGTALVWNWLCSARAPASASGVGFGGGRIPHFLLLCLASRWCKCSIYHGWSISRGNWSGGSLAGYRLKSTSGRNNP